MAKETTIIFVYDIEKLQKEEDDPASAILYFHPTWVSDQQKSSLCGQIVGTIQCVKNVLAKPKIISLQTGKFYIIQNNRYLLGVGTDRNITDLLLEHRANAVYSLVKFFHNDFVSLAELYHGEGLPAKLYHIFDTYLKMLAFGGNIFSHIPTLNLPKSASSVYMEAAHILECCQDLENVLGGSMLYHNKVVATQLSADLTKRIILTDPYRIKCPSDAMEVSFELPVNVQLLQVYISSKEYNSLLDVSNRNRFAFQYLCSKDIKKSIPKSSSQQDTSLVSAMKRDQSLIFTAVPEEGPDSSNQPFVPAVVKKSRPKFLNLKSASIDEASERKSRQVGTPLCGQTSVASTPVADLKRFVHQNPMSICTSKGAPPQVVMSIQVPNESSKPTDIEPLKMIPYMTVTSNKFKTKRSTSLTDINELIDSITKDASQYFNTKNKHFIKIESPKKQKHRNRLKSVADPTFPVFRQDGLCVSKAYYNRFVESDIDMVKQDLENIKINKVKANGVMKGVLGRVKQNNDCILKNDREIVTVKSSDEANHVKVALVKGNKDHRKSLNLPLKSLTAESEGPAQTPLSRRYSSGVQLTPLLSKLSILAFEDRSSGFGSRETTPSEYRGFTPTHSKPLPHAKLKKDIKTASKTQDKDAMQKCVLFVCGQQDVVLTVLMREECCREETVVKKLYDICMETLPKMEKLLAYSIETQSSASSAGRDGEPYSFLCLDADWDTIKRGGPWGANDSGASVALNRLHRDFQRTDELTEILLRCGESIIYGNNTGPAEVYYHEPANVCSGLPPPGDTMGLVQLKARRRLERDHGVLLL
ncbi:unnamed protein product [Acanthoscelides obtectus]|uniref:CCZ1/INTU/HSP4 first Longin domain-containing protein n=3 Tax=Acanthoscelides obtectus TaxID=200917 RepID=A0A9P0M550_ACAOB|nr:unnamed protein product [Acanthoscelides obtectus]CAK1629413.1 Hermansky-Pudlak syndrome 4 protein [Acanthoscelides obtectus]